MTSSAAPKPLHGWKLVLAGFAIALSNFATVLDLTITNVAVPHIAGSLAVSPSQGTWTITSYAVAEAICLPLSGWLASRFGLLRTYMFAMAGFAIFSLICGLAYSLEMLVIARVAQGFAGAPIVPTSQTLLLRIFPPEKRNLALGLWAMTTILAPVMGPILGGYFSDNWSWPWVFLINVPIIAFCFGVMYYIARDQETKIEKTPIDKVGFLLLAISVGAFQIMLDTGQDNDWFGSPTIVALAITALIGFAAFAIWEWGEEHPVVDLRIFRYPGFRYATIAFAMAFGVFFASIVLIPLWLQKDIGYTASEAGYAMCLMGVTGVCASPLAARLMGKVDTRITVSGAILWFTFCGFLRSYWTTGDSFWDFVIPQFLHGFGIPFFFMGLTALTLSAVPEKQVTSAAGIVSFFRTLAGASATTIAVSMWDIELRVSRSELAGSLNGAGQAAQLLQDQGFSLGQARVILERLVDVQANTVSLSHLFLYGSVFAGVAAALIWMIPKPEKLADTSAAH